MAHVGLHLEAGSTVCDNVDTGAYGPASGLQVHFLQYKHSCVKQLNHTGFSVPWILP